MPRGASADDVRDGVRGAHFVKVYLLHAASVYGGFGLRKPGEGRGGFVGGGPRKPAFLDNRQNVRKMAVRIFNGRGNRSMERREALPAHFLEGEFQVSQAQPRQRSVHRGGIRAGVHEGGNGHVSGDTH